MNVQGLTDELTAISSWREKEILLAKQCFNFSREDKPDKDYALRCLIIILYAHCEGFVKDAILCFIHYYYNNDGLHKFIKGSIAKRVFDYGKLKIFLESSLSMKEIEKNVLKAPISEYEGFSNVKISSFWEELKSIRDDIAHGGTKNLIIKEETALQLYVMSRRFIEGIKSSIIEKAEESWQK
ncbi:MAG: hypothetical protein JKP92_07810 [Alphaproteobacteria bacterium]|jgi:hypothetical protein|nr:hypothetical protein [Alphaproteobacteria bacterium]